MDRLRTDPFHGMKVPPGPRNPFSRPISAFCQPVSLVMQVSRRSKMSGTKISLFDRHSSEVGNSRIEMDRHRSRLSDRCAVAAGVDPGERSSLSYAVATFKFATASGRPRGIISTTAL
jgi:hypothetical protein